jgi:hypothetical protein
MKHAMSVSRSIKDTRVVRGRCLAAALTRRRKEKQEWGLRNCFVRGPCKIGNIGGLLNVQYAEHLCEMGRFVVGQKEC